mgnify:CR=1 FL=1
MFFYIVFMVLGSLSFVEIFSKKTKLHKAIEVIVVAFTTAVSSLRCGPTGDYEAYKLVFLETNINDRLLHAITVRNTHATEVGYNLLNFVSKSIINDFRFFIFVEALLVNVLLYIVIKKILFDKAVYECDYCITVYWIAWSLGLYNIIVVRQTLAVLICWYSLKYIKEKNIAKFILATILAFSIHRISIVWIVAYWIYWKKTRTTYGKVIFLSELFICSLVGIGTLDIVASGMSGMLGEKARHYLNLGVASYGENYNVVFILAKSIVNTVFLLVVFLYIYNRFQTDAQFCGMFNLYALGCAISLASCFISNEFARAGTCFSMLSIFLMTYIFRIKASIENRIICFGTLGMYILLRFYVYLHGQPELYLLENIMGW